MSPLLPLLTSTRPQLTAKELEAHPEFPYVIWDLKPSQKGKIPVANGRGGPLNIAYEVHGHGPRHLVLVAESCNAKLIMGLGGLRTSWQRQTKDFGHKQADKYSVLVFDNRGIGDSDKPLMRYSTSEMALDTLEVLEHLGWTQERSLNVMGISMGGMIAQEVALLIPTRIATLNLVSTAAQLVNTVGFLENLQQRASMFIPKQIDAQIADTKALIYTSTYLNSPDTLEYVVQPFPTSGDRFGAAELQKRSNPHGHFTRTGFIAQAVAAGWHKKTPEDLAKISREVGKDRILVVHGTEDKMITVPHGRVLVKGLSENGEEGEVKNVIWEGQGHVIPIEKREEFNALIDERIERWHGKV